SAWTVTPDETVIAANQHHHDRPITHQLSVSRTVTHGNWDYLPVILLSDGNSQRFLEALAMAQQDWRDVLVAAQLAHHDWPDRLNAALGRARTAAINALHRAFRPSGAGSPVAWTQQMLVCSTSQVSKMNCSAPG
ncbi:hypothetical protein ACFQS1_40600, partial [Paractinoplanes rhizophilus]